MTPLFESFLRELQVADPQADLSPLEEVLLNIEFEPDELAVSLFGPIKWTVRQRQYSPAARLAFIHHLLACATATDMPTLH